MRKIHSKYKRKIVIVKAGSCGVEVFRVYVDQRYLCERFSLYGPGSAMDVAKRYLPKGMYVWHESEKYIIIVPNI